MKRGDLVTVAMQGDAGKPRPALIVQSDFFSPHPTVTILPITSDLRATPLFRITVQPDTTNGLSKPSQIMIDKLQSVARSKIGQKIGRLEDTEMLAVNRALAIFLDFA